MCICVCVCGGGEKAQKVPPAPTCGVAQVLHDVGGFFLRRTPWARRCLLHNNGTPKITRKRFSRAKAKGMVADDDDDADDSRSRERFAFRKQKVDIRYAEGAARLGGATE